MPSLSPLSIVRNCFCEVLVTQTVYHHTFANGLTLVAERLDHVRSVAVNFLVPAGCAYDPPDQLGLAGVLADLITRGAGNLDSRELTLALDNLGVDHSESVGVLHSRLWGSTLARNLPQTLAIYADILRRPHLPEEELEACAALALQDLQGLEDEPGARVMVELRRHLYPTPLSNDHRGTVAGLEALTIESMRRQYEQLYQPNGLILSVAGNIEWPQLLDRVGELFADWPAKPRPALQLGPEPVRTAHVYKQLEQTQITVAYPSVPVADPDYYAAMGAVNVLSGGMGARLFTEIREKEGLCYSVGASYSPIKDRGSVIAYAASLNHQAQRTLDKLLHELRRLPEGIEDEEVDRVRVGLKTALIMQQESTSARTLALASDWYYLGRVRTFDEIQSAINGLSARSILDHLHRHPPRDFRVVTLGPTALDVSGAVND
jgi:predicted Zn-dependent peptidase